MKILTTNNYYTKTQQDNRKSNGVESSLMNEHRYMNHRGNVSNFMNFNGGYGYIVPSPKAFTTPEKVLQAEILNVHNNHMLNVYQTIF